jgi:hypothetical protein
LTQEATVQKKRGVAHTIVVLKFNVLLTVHRDISVQ